MSDGRGPVKRLANVSQQPWIQAGAPCQGTYFPGLRR